MSQKKKQINEYEKIHLILVILHLYPNSQDKFENEIKENREKKNKGKITYTDEYIYIYITSCLHF
jgi:hypothetical protein